MDSRKRRSLSVTLLLATTTILYAIQLFYARYYSLDLPFSDTWSLFDPGAVTKAFNPHWIIAFHNDHRIAVTRFIAWVLFRLNGLNLLDMLVILHIFFAALLLATYALIKDPVKKPQGWLIALGLALTTSPINWENHSLPFNIHFHVSILFSFLFLLCVFTRKLTWTRVALGALTSSIAVYSFAGGATQVLMGLVAFLICFAWDRKSLSKTLTVAGYCAVLLGLYFIGYKKPEYHPPMIWPTHLDFWKFYAEVLSLGFGLRDLSAPFSSLVLLLVHIPGIYFLKRTHWLKTATDSERRIFTAWAGLLLVLATIALSRTGFGMAQAKASRYAEWGLFCVPLTLALWVYLWTHSKIKRPLKKYSVAAVVGFLVLSFWDEWGYPGAYIHLYHELQQGETCVVAFYRQPDRYKHWECPFIAAGTLSHNLRYAEKQNYSYYRTAMRLVPVAGK